MTDDRRFLRQRLDGVQIVIGDGLNLFVREHFWMVECLSQVAGSSGQPGAMVV